MMAFPRLRDAARAAAMAVVCLAALSPATAIAQANADGVRLSEALRTLARNPQSFDALLAAGEASLKLDDLEAALGFFRRADAIQSQDPRVQAGLGSVMARQRQPLEALRLFAEAERGGALSLPRVADRGLAYDLIGDNARAQQDYQLALAAGPDPVVTRRLALSLAISGDQKSSESTLLPLLQRQDLAAYRTRAFALAILGKGDEAVSIAETMLPDTLSGRMAPYLRYMPRLTRAQQAAAANLGAFPPAGDIGRDDPALAAYAASIGASQAARTADSRLVPSGAPLGREAGPVPVRVATAQPVRTAPPPAATPAPPPAARPVTTASGPVQVASAAPTTPASQRTGSITRSAVPERARAMLEQHPNMAIATASRPANAPPPSAPLAGPELARVTSEQAASTASSPSPVTVSAAPLPVPTPAPAPVAGPPVAQPVVVAALDPTPPLSAPAATVAPTREPAPQITLSEAFADLRAVPVATPSPASPSAVDITRIQPRREQAAPAKPPAPPKPPPVPSRQWVQVATGKSTSALAFDWKRIKREANGLLDRQTPSTADWGQTNRLVVGPFPTAAAADQLIGKLKDKKIDAFRFTSAVGEAVTPLR